MIRFRRAVRFRPAVERAIDVCFRSPLNIIGHEQVEQSIPSVVYPCSAGAEFVVAPQSGLLRHVGECAVAVIAEKMALAERRYENAIAAAVVVVAYRHSHS